jgi:uncharacterized coiled-coil protein SlyX
MSVESKKRSRNLSTYSEYQTPARKQTAMNTVAVNAEGVTPRAEHTLADIMNKITDMQQSIENKIEDVRISIMHYIDEKLSTMKTEIDADIEELKNDMKGLKGRIDAVDEAAAAAVPVQDVETSVKVVIKGLAGEIDERLDITTNAVLDVFRAMKTDVSVISAARTRSGPPDQPRFVIVELSRGDRVKVLKAKYALKTIEKYKAVYIDIDRSTQERRMDSNIRALVKAIPTLEYKRGKIVQI